jgi:hypothetical protein
MTTSGTGVWPGVEAGVEATCLADVDGTDNAVIGVVDVDVEELIEGCVPQFVWVKAA